jgi:hypothetical protein
LHAACIPSVLYRGLLRLWASDGPRQRRDAVAHLDVRRKGAHARVVEHRVLDGPPDLPIGRGTGGCRSRAVGRRDGFRGARRDAQQIDHPAPGTGGASPTICARAASFATRPRSTTIPCRTATPTSAAATPPSCDRRDASAVSTASSDMAEGGRSWKRAELIWSVSPLVGNTSGGELFAGPWQASSGALASTNAKNQTRAERSSSPKPVAPPPQSWSRFGGRERDSTGWRDHAQVRSEERTAVKRAVRIVLLVLAGLVALASLAVGAGWRSSTPTRERLSFAPGPSRASTIALRGE